MLKVEGKNGECGSYLPAPWLVCEFPFLEIDALHILFKGASCLIEAAAMAQTPKVFSQKVGTAKIMVAGRAHVQLCQTLLLKRGHLPSIALKVQNIIQHYTQKIKMF